MDRKYLMSLQGNIEKEIHKIEEKDILSLFEVAKKLVSAAYILELGNDFKTNYIKIISIRAILESKFYGSGFDTENEKYNMLLIDEAIGLGDHYVDDTSIVIRRKKNDETDH